MENKQIEGGTVGLSKTCTNMWVKEKPATW